jgi:uncharacterized membrane protein
MADSEAAVAAGGEGPSGWRERLVLAAVALAGLAISLYLAAYQLGAVAEPWDPLFGPVSSSHVLRSALSRALPVPDAAVGAVAYALEIALDLAGGADRWRTHPWIVLAFGAVATALGISSVGLVFVQVAIVRSGCLLCLGSAAASIGVAAAVWSGGELEAAFHERRLRPRRGDAR